MSVCAATDCHEQVSAEMLMCKAHWFRLPKEIRNEVWATWKRVHRDREAYRDARDRAVRWIDDNPPQTRQGRLF